MSGILWALGSIALVALGIWYIEVYTPRKHMREAIREADAMFRPQHWNCRCAPPPTPRKPK